ncbi:hypothetical protein [Archangium primigenium]|uniref:hypothetical protein n=1 Tax=[Archangium] primigenium TaxID=2792470 RepID=UPI00195F23E8|nr:hypothetical protein [Archangium primigenium]MBM7114514.1 hypothetical protein [Archangium primigenium]
MNWVLYRSRVWRSFHWLPTLALPLVLLLIFSAQDIALLLSTNFDVSPRLESPSEMLFLPLVLALGSIGRDASTGLLPVLLTRAVPRSSYVLTSWAALGTVASFWALLHLLAQGGLILMASALPHESIFYTSGWDFLINGLERVTLCFGMAAPLVAFSTRLPAFGNIVMWGALFYLVELVLPGYGRDDPFKIVFTLRQFLSGLLMPMLELRPTFDATPISWARLFTYLSNIALWLWLGIHVFNRREVSYASR